MDYELVRSFIEPVYAPRTTDEVVKRLLADLRDLDIYVHNHSITTNSHYLKFADDRIGSIRVGDHPGKKKYAYRWNIWLGGIDSSFSEVDRGVRRWHYHVSDIEDFARHVHNYAGALSPESPKERQARLDRQRLDRESEDGLDYNGTFG